MTLVEGALEITSVIDSSFPAARIRLQLKQLAKEAEHALMDEPNPHLRLEGLIRLFYREWGFQGDHQQYFSSENALLDKVLERKKGIPVSLGAIFLYLARHLELPVSSVGFPTQYILKIDWYDGEQQFINPFDGEYISLRTLRGWLIGYKGPFCELKDEHLTTADNKDILARWLTVLKSALSRRTLYRCFAL